MKADQGETLTGTFGTAVELLFPNGSDWPATLASWFLHCPGQSPAWSHFLLAIIHLREIDGAPPAHISVPHATHEVMLVALDPARLPNPEETETWSFLRPANVTEQIELPNDDEAVVLLRQCAQAVVDGVLPAEPLLSGAVEPWRTTLIQTAAHARGEVHGL